MSALKSFFQQKYQQLGVSVPRVHFVLGSCIGRTWDAFKTRDLLSSWEIKGRIAFSEVPGLVTTSVVSHAGYYEYLVHKDLSYAVCVQSGRLHGYELLEPHVVVRSVVGPCIAGTSRFVLSNISGGLSQQFPVGCIVSVRDHINLTGKSPLPGMIKHMSQDLAGSEMQGLLGSGDGFLGMEDAYHVKQTAAIAQQFKRLNMHTRSGVYVGVNGPQYETPSEVQMLAQLGADVVGMSTVWEVIALHYLKASVSVCSVVSNLACGIGSSVEFDEKDLQPAFTGLIQSILTFAKE